MAAVLPVKNPEADPGQREQHEHGPFVRQIHRWLRRVGAEHKPPQTNGQGREQHEYPDHEYQRPAATTTKVGKEFHFFLLQLRGRRPVEGRLPRLADIIEVHGKRLSWRRIASVSAG